jgi:Protein of unknown function (DUF2934)
MPAKKTVGHPEETIRESAYFLWEQNGRPAGRDLEFWSRAAELLAAAAPELARSRKAAARKAPAAKPRSRARSAA